MLPKVIEEFVKTTPKGAQTAAGLVIVKEGEGFMVIVKVFDGPAQPNFVNVTLIVAT